MAHHINNSKPSVGQQYAMVRRLERHIGLPKDLAGPKRLMSKAKQIRLAFLGVNNKATQKVDQNDSRCMSAKATHNNNK